MQLEDVKQKHTADTERNLFVFMDRLTQNRITRFDINQKHIQALTSLALEGKAQRYISVDGLLRLYERRAPRQTLQQDGAMMYTGIS